MKVCASMSNPEDSYKVKSIEVFEKQTKRLLKKSTKQIMSQFFSHVSHQGKNRCPLFHIPGKDFMEESKQISAAYLLKLV